MHILNTYQIGRDTCFDLGPLILCFLNTHQTGREGTQCFLNTHQIGRKAHTTLSGHAPNWQGVHTMLPKLAGRNTQCFLSTVRTKLTGRPASTSGQRVPAIAHARCPPALWPVTKIRSKCNTPRRGRSQTTYVRMGVS